MEGFFDPIPRDDDVAALGDGEERADYCCLEKRDGCKWTRSWPGFMEIMLVAWLKWSTLRNAVVITGCCDFLCRWWMRATKSFAYLDLLLCSRAESTEPSTFIMVSAASSIWSTNIDGTHGREPERRWRLGLLRSMAPVLLSLHTRQAVVWVEFRN